MATINSNRRFLSAVAVVMIVATAELLGNAAAATYIVGDNLGWTVPSGGPATYTTWASQYVFVVGDVLVFNFSTGFHDVAHVTEAQFDGCSATNPIALATVGPASFTLNSSGPDYYICTFGSHCSLGQKLTINVTASPSSTPAPAPSPAAAPSPAPSSGATPAPSPGPSPALTPSGAATPAPSPASGLSPDLAPFAPFSPTGELIPPPPPPPSAAAIAAINARFVVFAAIALGLVMV